MLDMVEGRMNLAHQLFDQLLRAARAIRVEARVEKLHQHRRDVRIERQRPLDVAMAEGPAGLAQVLAVGPEDDDLAPGELGAQNQTVESVILHVTAPDPGEGLLELVANLIEVELVITAEAHAEIVHPHARAVAPPNLARLLLLHPQPHVLEHGQGVGEKDRSLGAEQLELQHPLRRLQRPVEAHGERVLVIAERLHLLDVVDGDTRRVVLAIIRAKPPAIAAIKAQPPLLPAAIEQRIAQIVAPVAGDFTEPRLDFRDVVDRVRAWRDANDEVQTGEHRLREAHVELDVLAAQIAHEQVLYGKARLGVEAIPRHVHDAGVEPTEGIPVDEDSDALALLQVQDTHGRCEQLVFGDLEQQIARERLQNVDQRLGGVAAFRIAGAGDDVRDLLAQQRNGARAAVIRRRCVESPEATHADDLARGIEALDADVVQITGAVHGGPHVRLGDDEQMPVVGHAAHVGRQTRECLGERVRLLALHPEPALRNCAQLILAIVLDELVLAVAEKGEMVVAHPLEKRQAVVELFPVQRRRARSELGEDFLELCLHGAPVSDGRGHVVEHHLDIGDDALEDIPVRLPIDLEVHDGLGEGIVRARVALEHLHDTAVLVAPQPHHRMDDQMGGQSASIERHAHRVHQERHVVGGDLDDGVRRLPSVLLELRVVDAQPRRAPRARAQKIPVRERGSVKVGDVALGQILVGGAGKVATHEALHHVALVGGHVPTHLFEHRIDELAGFGRVPGHGDSSRRGGPLQLSC